jgi:predicted kinase
VDQPRGVYVKQPVSAEMTRFVPINGERGAELVIATATLRLRQEIKTPLSCINASSQRHSRGSEPRLCLACPALNLCTIFSSNFATDKMEAVVLMGIPGSGKTSFAKERLFHTHVRISLDLLKTRHRERRLLEFCLTTEQRFVVDNTNPTRLERAAYIEAAKRHQFHVIGYYFQSIVADCLLRNAQRADIQRVPEAAILSISSKFELPRREEGFDQLYYVRLNEAGIVIEEWRDDL